MNKYQEIYFFKKFQETYPKMPLGTAEFVDRPDVIFTTESGDLIGIELTECIYDELLMKKSEFQIKFNKNVISKLEGKLPFKFHLDIDLDKKYQLKQNQIEQAIDDLITICMKEFSCLNLYESKYVEQLEVDWDEAPNNIQQYFLNQGYRKLPRGIARIQMSRYDILEKSRHPESKGGVVPDFTDEHLHIILKKKNKAMLNYKVCNEQWLLICEGSDFYSYFNNVRINNEFETNFKKIFIYRMHPSKVIVIK